MQLPSSGHESRGRIDDIERTRSVFRVARTGRGGCRAPDWKEQEWLRLWGWWPSHHHGRLHRTRRGQLTEEATVKQRTAGPWWC